MGCWLVGGEMQDSHRPLLHHAGECNWQPGPQSRRWQIVVDFFLRPGNSQKSTTATSDFNTLTHPLQPFLLLLHLFSHQWNILRSEAQPINSSQLLKQGKEKYRKRQKQHKSIIHCHVLGWIWGRRKGDGGRTRWGDIMSCRLYLHESQAKGQINATTM